MSIDLDAIESRIATGIYGDDRLSKEERNDAFSALAEIIAEVETLRQALSDAEATLTGAYFALRPEGGVNGWRPSRGVDPLIDLALTVREDAEGAASGRGYRADLSLDDIRCDVLDTGWPLGDDTDPERTPRRLVREVLAELAHARDQRDNLQAACDRLRANADARERFLRREGDRLRAAERDAEDAEKGAAACDQIVALLDGIPVEAPCPEAARVTALLSERDRLRDLVRHQRGALYDAGLLTEAEYATLAADSAAVARLEGYDALRAGLANIEQIVRDGMAVARTEGVAEGERRVVAYLRRESYPCCHQCNNQLADYIERGEHRKVER